MAGNLMQPPPAPESTDTALHPVVAGSATQTNARTGGGMVSADPRSVDALQRMHDAGMFTPQPTNAQSSFQMGQAGMPVELPAPVVSGPTQPWAPSPRPDPRANMRGRAAAHAAMAYLTGSFDGAASASAAPAAPVPAAAPAAAPAPAPVASAAAPVPAPAGDHPLNAAARSLPRDAFVRAFHGVPGFMVLDAMNAAKPPSMDDQAKRASLAVAAQHPENGMLGRLLMAYGLGPNYTVFQGMNQE